MPYYTKPKLTYKYPEFARYAEIMPYYTKWKKISKDTMFARYAEIMPYYTFGMLV